MELWKGWKKGLKFTKHPEKQKVPEEISSEQICKKSTNRATNKCIGFQNVAILTSSKKQLQKSSYAWTF